MRSALVLALALAATTVAPPVASAEDAPQDFDKDGVPDSEDDCPTDPGPKESAGCKKDLRAAKPAPSPSAAPEVAKLEADHLVLPRPVEFERGSARLVPSAGPLIAALAVAVAKLAPSKKLVVRGHTDDRGAKAANVLLSKRRAQAVVKALTDHGVEPARLDAQGVGPGEPVADNATEAGRAKNRRVEFRLLDVEVRLPGSR